MALADESRAHAATLPGFARDSRRSHGDPASPNALIHAENLGALTRLRRSYAGRIRCAYFDPPFNTGRTFAEYKDVASPDAWRAAIQDRLAAAHALLSDDGAIFVEIDDNELAHLVLAMDAIFGRENRVSIVTIVRSASTGHKAQNRGPVHVSDFLVVYAKDKAAWRCNAQWKVRRGYDKAYATFLENRDDDPARWRFSPLSKHARAQGCTTRSEVEAFAIEHAASVVRFAQPRYEAVSREAQRFIDRSKLEPNSVLRLARARHKDILLRAGNRVLFLADKVREHEGRKVLVEPLTNVWDDVPFQGIAKEGGVVFSRNKKPERLLARILAMATDPGDWVLDAFLGSGTTAAVAHKMGRRWIGIEQGDHVDELCLPRLRRVVDGEDKTGITRETAWEGGGGFGVHA